MSVVTSLEDVGPCRKEVHIEIPAAAVDAEIQRIVGEFGKQVRLPGFRKGKTPQSIVRKRFKEQIDQEVLERLLPRYWQQAQSEKSLKPLLQPQVEDIELEDGKPLTFKATVEVQPEVELDDDRDFDLPDGEVSVGEIEVDEVVERIQNDAAPWVVVERAAMQGDLVKISIEEVKDEEEPEADGEESSEGDAEPQAPSGPQEIEVEVGDPRVWEELSVALTGMEAGQKSDFTHEETRTEETETEDGEMETEEVVHAQSFRFDVVEVKEKDLPEVDDELAKKAGDFESLEALREDIESRIRLTKTNEARQKREEALLDQLREKYPLELPEGVVNQEAEGMMREYAENLARSGVDVAQVQIDWQKIADEAKPQAEKRVHARLLLDAFAEKDGIEASEEDIDNAVSMIARGQNQSAGQVRKALEESGRLEMLQEQLQRDKTLRQLLGEEELPVGGDSPSEAASGASEDTSEEE
ncbi:MAG: trigger factor [Acidobacteriota bacterium]